MSDLSYDEFVRRSSVRREIINYFLKARTAR